ncbi:MAG: LEPR-XLL domain-containing protein, partial [Verrucomicrobiota bacterium]
MTSRPQQVHQLEALEPRILLSGDSLNALAPEIHDPSATPFLESCIEITETPGDQLSDAAAASSGAAQQLESIFGSLECVDLDELDSSPETESKSNDADDSAAGLTAAGRQFIFVDGAVTDSSTLL